VIRGGNLTFVLKANVAGFNFEVKSDQLTIQGQNPSGLTWEDTVRNYIQQQANAQGLAGYTDDLDRIARQEGGGIYRQFLNNMPYFSKDDRGGAGLYQITPATTGDLIWNWQSNVVAGVAKFRTTIWLSQRLNVIIQGPTFSARVQDLNNWRISQGLPPIPLSQVYVPPLNADQIRRNAIRGFNGYGGTDQHLGGKLNEYTLSFNSNGLLDLTYNATTRRWEASWVQVPESDRPQDFGDPAYVRHVLSQQP